MIRGFMHLPRHEQERLRPVLAAHLKRRLGRPGLPPSRPALRRARPSAQETSPLTYRSSES
jgi:hypothetical protein